MINIPEILKGQPIQRFEDLVFNKQSNGEVLNFYRQAFEIEMVEKYVGGVKNHRDHYGLHSWANATCEMYSEGMHPQLEEKKLWFYHVWTHSDYNGCRDDEYMGLPVLTWGDFVTFSLSEIHDTIFKDAWEYRNDPSNQRR